MWNYALSNPKPSQEPRIVLRRGLELLQKSSHGRWFAISPLTDITSMNRNQSCTIQMCRQKSNIILNKAATALNACLLPISHFLFCRSSQRPWEYLMPSILHEALNERGILTISHSLLPATRQSLFQTVGVVCYLMFVLMNVCIYIYINHIYDLTWWHFTLFLSMFYNAISLYCS